MRLALPKLYVILDGALIRTAEQDCAGILAEAGVRLIQYRNKSATSRRYLETSRELATLLSARGVSFIVNDRVDIAFLGGASGVHVGQEDLDAEQARSLLGPEKVVGVSTHNLEQFKRAAATSADYIAVGPLFPTVSKANPDPIVGVDFLRRVRALTDKPIVAIGGITLERAVEVIEAGADAVAVLSDILCAPDPGQRAGEYIKRLEPANRARAV